jgi:cell division protein FtsL
MASSSQTVLSPEPEVNYSQIMEAIAAIQGGMSSMQVTMSSMQQEIHSINLHVEQKPAGPSGVPEVSSS